MHTLLIGTKNRGKIVEVAEYLSGLPCTLLSPADLSPAPPDPQETGETFAENALQKAHHYFEATGVPTLADDSGLMVEALVKELGIHTRRWGAGPNAGDEEWIRYFLKRMAGERNKRAHFVCVLAYKDSSTEVTFEGRTSGTITETLEAEYLPGLPLSPCFRPDGSSLVYSAMSIEQKNSTSHRGKALLAFRNFQETRKTLHWAPGLA